MHLWSQPGTELDLTRCSLESSSLKFVVQFKPVRLVIIKVYLLHVCSFCVLYDD
jgi:hypothetical protein